MPPKLRRPAAAKAVAKAKAKAVVRRVRGLRRPSAAEEEIAEGDLGELIDSPSVTLAQCRNLKDIEVVKGTYWTAPFTAALRVKEARLKDGRLILSVQVLGTRNEELLKTASGRPGQAMEAHLCEEGCPGTPHDEGLLHVTQFRHLGPRREDWMENLLPGDRAQEGEDELDELRRDRDVMVRDRGRREEPHREKRQPPSPAGSDKDDKKKKRSRSRRKKRSKLKVDATKAVKTVLGDTGADPDPAVRKRFRRRAARLAKRSSKDARRGSSDSSTSSSSSQAGDNSLFGSTSRVQKIGRELPGALVCAALEEASESLIQQEGGIWELGSGPLPAIFSRYYRQQLAHRMSPAMGREAQTLAQALDYGLRGKIAELLDLCGQRLKALEMQSSGVHFSVAQQQELLVRDSASLSTTPEFKEVTRLAREEGRSRLEASRPFGARASTAPRGDDWSKGSGKKGGQKGKSQKGDPKKGDGEKGDAKKHKPS
eukprot:s327_g25.t1